MEFLHVCGMACELRDARNSISRSDMANEGKGGDCEEKLMKWTPRRADEEVKFSSSRICRNACITFLNRDWRYCLSKRFYECCAFAVYTDCADNRWKPYCGWPVSAIWHYSLKAARFRNNSQHSHIVASHMVERYHFAFFGSIIFVSLSCNSFHCFCTVLWFVSIPSSVDLLW